MTATRRDLLPLALASPWATWAVARAAGLERGFPLVPGMAFTPYAAATAVLPLGFALARGSRAGTVLAAAATGALGAVTLRRALARPGPRPEPVPGGRRLRVVSANLLHGRAEADAVVDLVRRHDADVLCLVELTPGADAALRAAGLPGLLPTEHVRGHRPGAPPAAGGAVWTRLEVLDRGGVPGRFEQPVVRLAVPGGPDVEVTAVHTDPPMSTSRTRRWERELAVLPPAGGPGPLRVLAGDFNATADHASFRRLLARGYADAATRVGQGLVHTWTPERRSQPRLTIDHVLVDHRIEVAWFAVHDLPGSDHRALAAELVLPAG